MAEAQFYMRFNYSEMAAEEGYVTQRSQPWPTIEATNHSEQEAIAMNCDVTGQAEPWANNQCGFATGFLLAYSAYATKVYI